MALHDLFDPDSADFLGSGMTLEELLVQNSQEAVRQSWASQGREERKRRLDLVRRLFLELERVRAATPFAVRLGGTAIEDVICGKWADVAGWASYFSFAQERDSLREEQAPIWAGFRDLLQEAAGGGPVVSLPGRH